MDTPSNQPSRPGDTTSEDRTAGAGLAQDIKQQAGELTEQAKSMAKSKAREAAQSGQELAAEQLDQFAEGVRRSAESWDDSQHAWVKQALASAADGIEQVSSTLRERDLSSLLSDAEGAARRHPAIFAAGCAVAGFALVRFLKSNGRSSGRGAYGRMEAGAGYDERASRAAMPDGYGERQSGYSSNI